MKVEIDLNKGLQENASLYHEKSKKAKRKLAGVEKAIMQTKNKLGLVRKKGMEKIETKKPKVKRKKEWYEKFHWFFTSDGYLCISGKDAKSNEAIVKKHMSPTDIYFHADLVGAPHTILKAGNSAAPKASEEEAAEFAALYSRAWKDKILAADVYSAMPEQVSKKAPSGESLGTGAFMIYGKRNWFHRVPLSFAIGVEMKGGKATLIGGPKSAIESRSEFLVEVKPGNEKKGPLSKKIKSLIDKKLGIEAELDDIMSLLPAGGSELA